MTGAAVELVDLTDVFWNWRLDHEERLFLRQDTHWSPLGVTLAARVVADRARVALGTHDPLELRTERRSVVEPTDLLDLLGLRPDPNPARRPAVEVKGVIQLPERPRVGDSGAIPVLLFGDSLTGYYDGEDAGFAQQLMLELGAIRAAFAANSGLLNGKRVVILEFHMNQLYSKDILRAARHPVTRETTAMPPAWNRRRDAWHCAGAHSRYAASSGLATWSVTTRVTCAVTGANCEGPHRLRLPPRSLVRRVDVEGFHRRDRQGSALSGSTRPGHRPGRRHPAPRGRGRAEHLTPPVSVSD